MEADARLKPELCNCLALRQAARHVTQFYDQFLSSSGLRTTREGLVAVARGRQDRRSREIRLTDAGAVRFRTAVDGWVKAQAGFEAVFGETRSAELRAMLHAVAASELERAASEPSC